MVEVVTENQTLILERNKLLIDKEKAKTPKQKEEMQRVIESIEQEMIQNTKNHLADVKHKIEAVPSMKKPDKKPLPTYLKLKELQSLNKQARDLVRQTTLMKRMLREKTK